MAQPVKGTVISLSSMFAPEEAQKASIRVQETISEHHKEVNQLQGFLDDNTNLVNLIKKLPDQLHHDIMVPFGKAAFFPGRLIHTNEFMVLLGEGYFVERTSKQTIDILKRRGKGLESQIETLKAVMQDLKFEASFFDNTAIEAAEGVVEIREDYVDASSASNEDKTLTGDEEYARILARFDELEKEELESEAVEENDEDDETDLSQLLSQTSLKPEAKNSEQQMKKQHMISEISLQNHTHQDICEQFKPEDSMAFRVSKELDSSSHKQIPASSGSNAPASITERSAPVSENEAPMLAANRGSDSSKAFTGSIVERADNIEKNQKDQIPAPAASKPVSRFKLQRK